MHGEDAVGGRYYLPLTHAFHCDSLPALDHRVLSVHYEDILIQTMMVRWLANEHRG